MQHTTMNQNQMYPSTTMNTGVGIHSNAYIPASVYPQDQTSQSVQQLRQNQGFNQMGLQNQGYATNGIHNNAYIPASVYPQNQTSQSVQQLRQNQGFNQIGLQNQGQTLNQGYVNSGVHTNAYIPASVYPQSQVSSSVQQLQNSGYQQVGLQNQGQTINSGYSQGVNAYIPASVYPQSQTSESVRQLNQGNFANSSQIGSGYQPATTYGSNNVTMGVPTPSNTQQNSIGTGVTNSYGNLHSDAYVPNATYRTN